MQCTLYKMLVYGEGGHFLKHQGTEKEGGMVVTLVVQLLCPVLIKEEMGKSISP